MNVYNVKYFYRFYKGGKKKKTTSTPKLPVTSWVREIYGQVAIKKKKMYGESYKAVWDDLLNYAHPKRDMHLSVILGQAPALGKFCP